MELPFTLAFLSPSMMVFACVPVAILMIPIVAILTAHQQKMAEILHRNQLPDELNDLRREVAELRSLMQRQTLAIEENRRPRPVEPDLSGRLRAGS